VTYIQVFQLSDFGKTRQHFGNCLWFVIRCNIKTVTPTRLWAVGWGSCVLSYCT